MEYHGTIFRPAIRPEDSKQGWAFCMGPYTNFGQAEWFEYGMHILKDVAIPTRHGTLYADLFIPDPLPQGGVPAIMTISPYGKHARPQWVQRGLDKNWLSHYSIGEGPDPGFWTNAGYAVAHVDSIGSWHSEGTYVSYSVMESEAAADAINWLGQQDWSSGAVALAGASYYSKVAWRIAAQQPEHLKAIVPWEGGVRQYGGTAHHGGIPSARGSYFESWSVTWNSYGLGEVEDAGASMEAHPFFDEYWADKEPDLSKVTVPVFTSAGWRTGEEGGHLGGTVAAFMGVASEHKWFLGWSYGHIYRWYSPEMNEKARQFLDYFLKGEGELPSWPRVQLSSRINRDEETPLRAESDFPIPDTEYRPIYLDAGAGRFLGAQPSGASVARYDATRRGDGVSFDYVFDQDTELTGYMKLKLWVEIDAGDEADLFVRLDKLDRNGQPMAVGLTPTRDPNSDGPVSRGWQRASHRELDPARSRDWLPVHTHRSREPLTPGDVIPVEIEIWPSSTLFHQGEGLRVLISGKDIIAETRPLLHSDANQGSHIIHSGDQHDSHLLLPVIPPRG